LAVYKNACVFQTVSDLSVGSYSLNFDWAARKNRPFKDCEFTVYMNDQVLDKFSPSDYELHNENVEFEVK
jgi:hypothetical protein